jgi:transposase
MIQPTLLLGLPSCVRLEGIELASQEVVLSLSLETVDAACPLCQQPASRVHSHSTRTLQDLSLAGKAVRLLVQVRRFFWETTTCARKIFAERLPELTAVSARRTPRCPQTLAEVGFALGGRAGVRLAAQCGRVSSRMTILRSVRHTPEPAASSPEMLGIDEWAYRRGKR